MGFLSNFLSGHNHNNGEKNQKDCSNLSGGKRPLRERPVASGNNFSFSFYWVLVENSFIFVVFWYLNGNRSSDGCRVLTRPCVSLLTILLLLLLFDGVGHDQASSIAA